MQSNFDFLRQSVNRKEKEEEKKTADSNNKGGIVMDDERKQMRKQQEKREREDVVKEKAGVSCDTISEQEVMKKDTITVEKNRKEEQKVEEKGGFLEECEKKKDSGGFFSSSWKVLILILILSILAAGAYPVMEQMVGGSYERRAQRYFNRGDFVWVLNETLSDKVLNLLLSKYSKEEEFRLGKNELQERYGIFLRYYISDKEKKFVKTNMDEEERRAMKEQESFVYAHYLLNPSKRMMKKVESSAKEGYDEFFYLFERDSIFDSGRETYRELLEEKIANHYSFLYYKEDGKVHYQSYDGRFVFDDGARLSVSPDESEYGGDKREEEGEKKEVIYRFEEMKKVRDEVMKNLEEEEIDIFFYIPHKSMVFSNPQVKASYYLNMAEELFILISVISGIGILLIFLIAGFAPYRDQKEAAIVQGFNQIFVELKLLFLTLPFAVLALMMVFIVNYDLLPQWNGINKEETLAVLMFSGRSSYYAFFAMATAFFGLLFIYLLTVYFKHIYHKGFLKGFIENTILGFLICKPLRYLGKIASVDLEKTYKRKVATLLAAHCALILITFFAFYHVPPLFVFAWIVYSTLLFSRVYRVLTNLAYVQNYTQKLAQGEFEIPIQEDIGIFSGIAKNFNSIKEGFKIAVEKEIKSQNLKTELISNVSHDLKTPLTSIINYSDLLKNKDLSEEEKREYIDILYQKSQRLKILIEDLFEASKASSGNVTLHKEELNVIALLRQTMGELQEKLEKSQLDLRLNLPDQPVMCYLDGRRTYRIFSNVLGNIAKYSMEATRVYIDATVEGDKIRFTFKNMSNYEMNFREDEIIERFQRGDKSRNTEGSGLGLAIAKSLTELQGGELKVEVDGDLFKLILIFPANAKR